MPFSTESAVFHPCEMLFFSARCTGLVRFDFTKLFDENEFVVRGVGQRDHDIGFNSGVIEESNPDGHLLYLSTIGRYFKVHVERPMTGEFTGRSHQTETVFRTDGKARNKWVGISGI